MCGCMLTRFYGMYTTHFLFCHYALVWASYLALLLHVHVHVHLHVYSVLFRGGEPWDFPPLTCFPAWKLPYIIVIILNFVNNIAIDSVMHNTLKILYQLTKINYCLTDKLDFCKLAWVCWWQSMCWLCHRYIPQTKCKFWSMGGYAHKICHEKGENV